MVSNTTLAIAGICSTAIVGYCIYFDKKRRSDPDFKKKLRERRRKKEESEQKPNSTQLPDLRNVEEVQKFFLAEVQKGEELLGVGKYEEGVEHLTNAVAVCGQPQQLLQVLQQTLPQPVFNMLLEKLPTISQRIVASSQAATGNSDKAKEEQKPKATIADVDELE